MTNKWQNNMLINSIKIKLRNNKLALKIWKKYKNIKDAFLEKKAIHNFQIERKIKRSGKIKVGFILQDLNVWNKTESIYQELSQDERFDTYLFCVPSWYGDNRVEDTQHINDTFEAVKNTYPDANVVNTYYGDDEWVDMKKYCLSYLFYTRPYNVFMPLEYQTSVTSKYLRICFTQYGLPLSKLFYGSAYNKDFFKNLYCLYADTEEEMELIQNRIDTLNTGAYQRAVYLGYSGYSYFINYKYKISSTWSFSNNAFRIIWTPRWTTDENVGGSNFFRYKDFLLKFANDNKHIDFVFRPHPLSFGNFINTGQMTVEEVAKYKGSCESSNIHLDNKKEYADTFWNSSVLISDFSTILVDYFITEKPIIFCKTLKDFTEKNATKAFQLILTGCYIANNENDITKYVNQLFLGIDPLKEKRKELKETLFGDNPELVPKRIMKDLVEDYLNSGNVI
jgi:hypothetical protein